MNVLKVTIVNLRAIFSIRGEKGATNPELCFSQVYMLYVASTSILRAGFRPSVPLVVLSATKV